MTEVPKLILCMEDDEDDCFWIRQATREVDPLAVFVHKPNGKEGLEFLQKQKIEGEYPCIILLDINMPVMGGRQTLAAIKNDPELRNIPVVVFTTSNNKDDQNFCETYGADMITKPSKFPEYKKKIAQVVLSRCR
jgi:CheY-like chemotaxis protein